jgi:hypothetical protein
LMFCNWCRNHEVDSVFDYIINLWTNVIFKFISVDDLTFGKNCLDMGDLYILGGKLKSLLWRLSVFVKLFLMLVLHLRFFFLS